MFEHLYRLRKLRNNITKKENGILKILLANFSNSEQKRDIEYRTPVVEDFFRTKIDVKDWRDKQDYRRDDKDFDWNNKEAIMNAMASNFDMPSWAYYHLENKQELDKGLNKYCEPFIYQLKGCNIHCPYCFVDDFNKNGKFDNGARFFSIPEIVDEFGKEREKRVKEGLNHIYRIRASGGEPTLVPEQWLSMLQEIEKRNLGDKIHFQSDTNLTTGYFLDELEEKGEIEKNIFEKIGQYRNFGLLCSFKGTDVENFVKNTRANPQYFYSLPHSFEKFVKAGIDAYPFLYNPNPKTLENFLEELARTFGENVYLKTWVLPLKMYEPIRARLGEKASAYESEWKSNFLKSEEKMRELLQKKFGIEYKKQLRVGIQLKVR